jgi:hypothetical protein
MKTFSEFIQIVEGKKKSNLPPNPVRDPEDGHREYTLAPHTGSTKPLKKVKKILKLLKDQGGIGRKAVEKGMKNK